MCEDIRLVEEVVLDKPDRGNKMCYWSKTKSTQTNVYYILYLLYSLLVEKSCLTKYTQVVKIFHPMTACTCIVYTV